MTVVRERHEDFGAVFDGEDVLPAHYGRPGRTHEAVRRLAGVREAAHGVLSVTGEDRHEFVDDTVSNAVPDSEGEGCYALLLDPDGTIEADLYCFATGDRLLLFTPRGRAETIAEEWRDRTFIQDVEIAVDTDEFGVFEVHGPKATEKVASVLGGPGTPEEPLSFVRGRVREVGVTVIRGDALAGEESYAVVCAAGDASEVFDALVTHGLNAVPFGRETYRALTLEAGTPLFDTELAGTLPNELGLRNAVDFEKGCFVGQEVVSRIENRGRAPRRLVGLVPRRLPDPGAAVHADGEAVGAVTRATTSPHLDEHLALALVDAGASPDAVEVGRRTVAAEGRELPFLEGSERSARLPTY